MEGRGLVLRVGLHQAEHLARGRLVEPDRGLEPAQRFEHVHDADAVHLGGDLGLRPRGSDKALRRQVVDFVRTRRFDCAAERRHVGQVAVHQGDVLFDAQFAQSPVRLGRPPRHEAVNGVALAQKETRQVGAILAGDARDQCGLAHRADFPDFHAPERLLSNRVVVLRTKLFIIAFCLRF